MDVDNCSTCTIKDHVEFLKAENEKLKAECERLKRKIKQSESNQLSLNVKLMVFMKAVISVGGEMKIEPCPWCGSHMVMHRMTVEGHDTPQQFMLRCSDIMFCEYTGPAGLWERHAVQLHNLVASLAKENKRLSEAWDLQHDEAKKTRAENERLKAMLKARAE